MMYFAFHQTWEWANKGASKGASKVATRGASEGAKERRALILTNRSHSGGIFIEWQMVCLLDGMKRKAVEGQVLRHRHTNERRPPEFFHSRSSFLLRVFRLRRLETRKRGTCFFISFIVLFHGICNDFPLCCFTRLINWLNAMAPFRWYDEKKIHLFVIADIDAWLKMFFKEDR